jgi:glycosyltransferase involved in cell wall biosynthesis
MTWFLRNARDFGLPSGVQVVAVGSDTDTLLPPDEIPPEVELRGWVSQTELDALLTQAAAAVVPQRLGFGALTRLPELCCAGVPVITFDHPTFAINPLPGLRTVSPDWREICTAMREFAARAFVVAEQDYESWEAAQPRPLASVLTRLLSRN